MHFFNPVPLMDLLEVVAGVESAPEAIAAARDAGERMGKRVIVARDGPGFLANRCARPFGLEALKLLVGEVSPTTPRSTGSSAWAAASGWGRSS